MNRLARLVTGMLLLALAAGATAQGIGGTDGINFVNAVRDNNGGKAVQLLRDKPAIIDMRGENGETALLVAINGREPDWVAFLLQNDADANLQGRDGDRPLIAAARLGMNEVVGWLLEKGAKVDATNKMGETALIVAVHNRHLPVVQQLLRKGADPDRQDAAAGLSARDYAKRDTRSRDILRAIEAKAPKPTL